MSAWRDTTQLTIASGQQVSNAFDFGSMSFCYVNVIVPAALAETIHLEVAINARGTFGIQTSGGTAIALVLPISGVPAATQIGPVVAGAIRLYSTTAVGAQRVFDVMVEGA
jgi:hypothetical protein